MHCLISKNEKLLGRLRKNEELFKLTHIVPDKPQTKKQNLKLSLSS